MSDIKRTIDAFDERMKRVEDEREQAKKMWEWLNKREGKRDE